MASQILLDAIPGAPWIAPIIDRLTAVWDQATAPFFADWSGYGVDLSDLSNPKIALFFRVPIIAPDLILGLFPTWVSEAGVELVGDIRMRAIPSRPSNLNAAPAGLHPGAGIRCESRDSFGNLVAAEDGTVGAMLRETANPENVWLLSAKHVIGRDNVVNRVELLDGSLVSQTTTSVKIVDGAPNLVDAAVAQCGTSVAFSAKVPGFALSGAASPMNVPRGTQVCKVGAAGSTTGSVAFLASRIEIDMSECCAVSEAEFQDQWMIRDGATPFSNQGDSGSLALTVMGSQIQPLGMLIANQGHPDPPLPLGIGSNEVFTVVTPFAAIISTLSGAVKAPLEFFQ